jgi:hypothetical protein
MRFHNQTRRSRSIPLSLLRRGRVLDLPIYWILRLSDLAREGLDHSGSHRFADHIYRSEPSGRFVIGRWLDALLLSLPATVSFRYRYVAARDEIIAFVTERATVGESAIDIFSVPCGIPRELADAAQALRGASVPLHGVRFTGSTSTTTSFARRPLLPASAACIRSRRIAAMRSIARHARTRGCDHVYGLAEFLTDAELERLYGIFFDVLTPGGLLITSGMHRRRFSDYAAAGGDPHAISDAADLARLARRLPFSAVRTYVDSNGIQTILKARK